MLTLALDLATHAGFALGSDAGVLAAGLWRLDRGYPSRWSALWWRMSDLHKSTPIEAVVIERPIVYPGRESGARVAFGLAAVAEWWAEAKGVSFAMFTASEIKRHATGRGNADKDAVKAAARTTWPTLTIETDDVSDALFLLDLAVNGERQRSLPAAVGCEEEF